MPRTSPGGDVGVPKRPRIMRNGTTSSVSVPSFPPRVHIQESPPRVPAFVFALVFIGSRRMGARRHVQALRQHRGFENNLHWQFDISFGEDRSRVQERTKAANFGLLRKMALSLLKRNASKQSIARKRNAAALDMVPLRRI